MSSPVDDVSDGWRSVCLVREVQVDAIVTAIGASAWDDASSDESGDPVVEVYCGLPAGGIALVSRDDRLASVGVVEALARVSGRAAATGEDVDGLVTLVAASKGSLIVLTDDVEGIQSPPAIAKAVTRFVGRGESGISLASKVAEHYVGTSFEPTVDAAGPHLRLRLETPPRSFPVTREEFYGLDLLPGELMQALRDASPEEMWAAALGAVGTACLSSGALSRDEVDAVSSWPLGSPAPFPMRSLDLLKQAVVREITDLGARQPGVISDRFMELRARSYALTALAYLSAPGVDHAVMGCLYHAALAVFPRAAQRAEREEFGRAAAASIRGPRDHESPGDGS